MYLIQGIFFQERHGIGLGFDQAGELAATWQPSMNYRFFSGGFGPDPENDKVMKGALTEATGPSDIVNIKLTKKRLTFTKKYPGRKDVIWYTFEKQPGGTWNGTYTGHAVGTGETNCIVTPVPDNFFAPTPVSTSAASKS